MQKDNEKKDFNTLIIEVEDCLKDNLFSDVDYYEKLLSQENFLSILMATYINNFLFSEEIIKRIVSNGYRVCDVQSVVDCMQGEFLDCDIMPMLNYEKVEEHNVVENIVKKDKKKEFYNKYFNCILSCEENIGSEPTFYLSIKSNIIDVQKLIERLLNHVGLDFLVTDKHEIKVSMTIESEEYNRPNKLFVNFTPIEENRTENYINVYGNEETVEVIFNLVRYFNLQIESKVKVENTYVRLQKLVYDLDEESQQIKLDRLIYEEELLSFWVESGKLRVFDLLEDMPKDANNEYIEDLITIIYDIDERSVIQVLNSTLSKLKPREEAVLRRRYLLGSMTTLESIGSFYNVSRERIRQVELVAKEKITKLKVAKKYQISSVLKLHTEYRNFFTEEELELLGLPKCLGIFLDLITEEVIWDDGFSVGFYNQRINKLINQELEAIPDEFLLVEVDDYARDIVQSIGEGITIQEVTYLIKRRYKEIGDFLIKGKLTLRVVLAYLMRTYFQNGLDVYDEEKIQFLREKAREHFDGFELAENDHAVASRIQSFCVPVARGVWRWATSESLLTEDLKEEICNYVKEYNSPVVPIHAVYITFEDKLNNIEIYNKYHLQGEVKRIVPKEYSVNRDYIFKDVTSSFYLVLESFVKESKSLVTKKDIIRNFPGVNDITIQQACAATKIINMNGYFVHLDNLAITDEERMVLKKSINEYLSEDIIYHAKNVFLHIRGENAGLFSRVGIEHYLQFYYLIKELFPNEFGYNRPFMANLGVDIISGEAQVIERISANKETDINELRQYAREVGTIIDRYIEFIDRNNDAFIFKNGHSIIMLETAGVYDDEFENIDDILCLFLGELQYRNLGEFYDYWKLPKINCSWNEWVLYSLINKYSKQYKGIVSSNYLSEAIPFIAKQDVQLENVDFSATSKITSFDDEKTDIEDILDFDDLE